MAWRTITAEGCDWQVRAVSQTAELASAEDVLEFQCAEGTRPTRRLTIPTGALATMDEASLLAAFRLARPIGADFYGRPGKQMPDMNP